MSEKSMLKNMLRHFFVAFGGLFYMTSSLAFGYQYAATYYDLPGRALTVVHDAAGDWWLDVDWTHPFLLGWFAFLALGAFCHAVWRRNDTVEYREPEVQSQPGF